MAVSSPVYTPNNSGVLQLHAVVQQLGKENSFEVYLDFIEESVILK